MKNEDESGIPKTRKVIILGGGTVSHVRAHLALAATAYGNVAMDLTAIASGKFNKMLTHLYLTRMAGGETLNKMFPTMLVPGFSREFARDDFFEYVSLLKKPDNSENLLETNEDIEDFVKMVNADKAVKVVFFCPAIVDFSGQVGDVPSGKYANRLKTTDGPMEIKISPAEKILSRIRENRKDIFLVAFKATAGATEDQQYAQGLSMLKNGSVNLVLANDIVTRVNMIITPEEARYHVTKHRKAALTQLVDMAWHRSHLTFTRSTVVDGQPVPWDSDAVYPALRAVVDHCISNNAYKPFNGATVGHFACKIAPNEFLTSIRKSDFNKLAEIGLVRVKTDGDDSVIAYGAKPSVGGQSQRIVFSDHPEYDCIVHFHVPKRDGSEVPVVSQREVECGSHACGKNTSGGMQRFGNLSAVMLDQHGPNIVFHHTIDPQEVINFIESNFDLSQKTGGLIQEGAV